MSKIKSLSNQDWDKFRSLEGMVRLVLITVWDPIGVFGSSYSLDEYDNYVLGVVGHLLKGATVDEIESHLHHIQETMMGFELNERGRLRERVAAEILFEMVGNYSQDA